jgi:hypothetical protein
MTSENKGYSPVSITNETLISKPVQLESFPISWSDWDFIRSRIDRCRAKLDGWGMAMSFFFSAAIFALGVALTSDSEVLRVIYFAVSGGTLGITLVCLVARLALGHVQHERIGNVLEDMEQMERRYQRPATSIATSAQT